VTAEFGVLIAVTLTNTLFWDAVPCSPVKVHWCFGGSTFFQNTSRLLLDYMALHPIRQYSFIQRVYFLGMNSGWRVLSKWTDPEPLKSTSQQHYIRTLTVFPFGILVCEQYHMQGETWKSKKKIVWQEHSPDHFLSGKCSLFPNFTYIYFIRTCFVHMYWLMSYVQIHKWLMQIISWYCLEGDLSIFPYYGTILASCTWVSSLIPFKECTHFYLCPSGC
jgi:hypothetical protein